MSTTTVVSKNGQIAIAADTLFKWGGEKNSAKYVVNHHKIIKIGENYIAVTGQAAGLHAIADYFAKLDTEVQLNTVDQIYNRWRLLHQALKDDYHLDVKDKDEDTFFESNGMDILIANPHGIFAVGSHRDIQQFSKFYSYGSGNAYALGAMYVTYEKEGYSAEEIARLGVAAAAEFDDCTGLPIVSYAMEAKP